jgi:hypothetical protein
VVALYERNHEVKGQKRTTLPQTKTACNPSHRVTPVIWQNQEANEIMRVFALGLNERIPTCRIEAHML